MFSQNVNKSNCWAVDHVIWVAPHNTRHGPLWAACLHHSLVRMWKTFNNSRSAQCIAIPLKEANIYRFSTLKNVKYAVCRDATGCCVERCWVATLCGAPPWSAGGTGRGTGGEVIHTPCLTRPASTVLMWHSHCDKNWARTSPFPWCEICWIFWAHALGINGRCSLGGPWCPTWAYIQLQDPLMPSCATYYSWGVTLEG